MHCQYIEVPKRASTPVAEVVEGAAEVKVPAVLDTGLRVHGLRALQVVGVVAGVQVVAAAAD